MTSAIKRDPIYRRRRFPPELIELCVRWYITYRLSYRDLVAMMAERGANPAVELRITLAPLSSPHRTRAVQILCELLDQTATVFPGTRLRLRFAVRPPPLIGLAFPGTPAHRGAPSAP